jgi:hypothetical protein
MTSTLFQRAALEEITELILRIESNGRAALAVRDRDGKLIALARAVAALLNDGT